MKAFKTTHEAYLQALRDVWFESQFKSAPRGLSIREILNYSFCVEKPTSEPISTFDEDRNKTIVDYTSKETDIYDSCTNKADDFAKASKFWSKLANPDGTVNSAYGYLIWKNRSHGNLRFEINDGIMRTPWEWAKLSLKQDKDTRQAILHFNLPEHAWVGNKDFTCTMYANFLIRDNKLHLIVRMRSNDLMKGLVYDLPWFVSLMDKMIEELKDTYPNLSKGTYTHSADSMHIYEKDELSILKMLGHA